MDPIRKLQAVVVVALVAMSVSVCDEGEVVVPPPAPLTVALTADPPSGSAPLAVDLTAAVSGSISGTLEYGFDCTGDGSLELTITTEANGLTAADACSYSDPGTYTVRVVVRGAGLRIEGSTTVVVNESSTLTADSVIVLMQDNFFSAKEVTVRAGTRVIWDNVGDKPHTSTSDDGIWDSGTVNSGGRWSWTVPADAQPGTSYPYYCVFHGDPGGQGMAGTIHVGTDSTPPPPPPSTIVTTPGLTFSPERVEISPGETVTWKFSGTTHNVTFEEESPPGGDIPNSPPGTAISRTFPNSGDYDYECTLHQGQEGRVRVR